MPLEVLIQTESGEDFDGHVFGGDLRDPDMLVVVVKKKTLARDVKKSVSPRTWNDIIGTFQLLDAHNREDELAARMAIAKITGYELYGYFDDDPSAPVPKKASYDPLVLGMIAASALTKRLEGARMIMWRNAHRQEERSIEPGILCRDHVTALYVCGVLRFMLACPCCSTPFLPSRPDQEYCSIRCRETFRKRRLRAKAKEGQKHHHKRKG